MRNTRNVLLERCKVQDDRIDFLSNRIIELKQIISNLDYEIASNKISLGLIGRFRRWLF